MGDTERTPCLETSVSKYLNKGMHLVYLDQCILSRFLEKPENEQWRDLRQIILKGNHPGFDRSNPRAYRATPCP